MLQGFRLRGFSSPASPHGRERIGAALHTCYHCSWIFDSDDKFRPALTCATRGAVGGEVLKTEASSDEYIPNRPPHAALNSIMDTGRYAAKMKKRTHTRLA